MWLAGRRDIHITLRYVAARRCHTHTVDALWTTTARNAPLTTRAFTCRYWKKGSSRNSSKGKTAIFELYRVLDASVYFIC